MVFVAIYVIIDDVIIEDFRHRTYTIEILLASEVLNVMYLICLKRLGCQIQHPLLTA